MVRREGSRPAKKITPLSANNTPKAAAAREPHSRGPEVAVLKSDVSFCPARGVTIPRRAGLRRASSRHARAGGEFALALFLFPLK